MTSTARRLQGVVYRELRTWTRGLAVVLGPEVVGVAVAASVEERLARAAG